MKNRIKSRWKLLRTEIMDTYIRLSTGDTSCLSRADRVSVMVGITAVFACFMTGQAFALEGEGGIIESGGDVAGSLQDSLVSISTKVAGFGLAACIIWFFICTSEEDAKRPLKWGKRIIIAYIVIRLIGPILTFIDDKTGEF